MTSLEKNHDTGLRILEVLKILLEEDSSNLEIMEKISLKNNIQCVYTKEAFVKYFNTLKFLGFDIKKKKTKYHLDNAIFKVDLTENEIEMLKQLILCSHKFNCIQAEKAFKSLFYKLDKYVNLNIEEFFDKSCAEEQKVQNMGIKANIINTLKKLLKDDLKVEITYKKTFKTQETIITELKEISETYIICYNSEIGRNKKIYIDNIVAIKQLPNKSSGRNYLNSVIFELYGRLAANYNLKPSERVIDFSNNHITVSNTEEDKDTLLHRLLKYGEYCKIIRPQYMQEEFIALTDEILKNLEAV